MEPFSGETTDKTALLKYIKTMDIDGAVLIFMPGWKMILTLMKHLLQHPLFVNVDKGLSCEYPTDISRYLEARYFDLFPWVPRPFEQYLFSTLSQLSIINFFRRCLYQPSSALTQNEIVHFITRRDPRSFLGNDPLGITREIGRTVKLERDGLLQLRINRTIRRRLLVASFPTSKRIAPIRSMCNTSNTTVIPSIRASSIGELLPVKSERQRQAPLFKIDSTGFQIVLPRNSKSPPEAHRLLRLDEINLYLKLIIGGLACVNRPRTCKSTAVVTFNSFSSSFASGFLAIGSLQRQMEHAGIVTRSLIQNERICGLRSMRSMRSTNKIPEFVTYLEKCIPRAMPAVGSDAASTDEECQSKAKKTKVKKKKKIKVKRARQVPTDDGSQTEETGKKVKKKKKIIKKVKGKKAVKEVD